MSEFKISFKKENNLNETPLILEQETPDLNNEIYYNCSECSSLIEILSINEEINTIKFKCLNKECISNQIIEMSLKEYLEKMKKYNKKEINNDECEMHNKKYLNYCFDCNRHLCKECLKTRTHLNHIKNNIIEIEPIKEELNIIKEIIKECELNIEKFSKEKQIKIKELNVILEQNKNSENNKLKKNLIKTEKKKERELKINNEKYRKDINEIKKRYEKEINSRREKNINDQNKIYNKYKLINEKLSSIYNSKINVLKEKYAKNLRNLKAEKEIQNNINIKKINEIILNTYDMYNNNYYNALNINSLLISYMKNDSIKNGIMKKILNNKFDEVCEIIQQRKKEDIKYRNIKEKGETSTDLILESKLKGETNEKSNEVINIKIKEINEKWKCKFEELKNKFIDELKKRENINQKYMEEFICKISNISQEIINKKIIDYKNNIDDIFKTKIESSINEFMAKKKYLNETIDDIKNTRSEIKNIIDKTKNLFAEIISSSLCEKI